MLTNISRAREAYERLSQLNDVTGSNEYMDVQDIVAAAEALGVQVDVADPAATWLQDDRLGMMFIGAPLGMTAGYRAGWCGHRVADSEWRAGYRVCERCEVDEDEVRWWALCVAHLVAGLQGAGVALDGRDRDCRVLVGDGKFTDYVRDWAHGLGEIDIVDGYVDWERFAKAIQIDYDKIEVAEGDFAGTWWVRR